MMDKNSQKRAEGFSIYPDPELTARIDKAAASDRRKRSPMAVLLIEEALDARDPAPKPIRRKR